MANGTPSYGDFSSVLEFQQAQNILIEAQDAFDALPASLRKRFDNDPAVMLEFIENPDNREEAEKLGLGLIFFCRPKKKAPLLTNWKA